MSVYDWMKGKQKKTEKKEKVLSVEEKSFLENWKKQQLAEEKKAEKTRND